MNKNIQSFLKFAALPAFLLTVLPALFLTSCGGGGGGGGSNSSGTKTAKADLGVDQFAVNPSTIAPSGEVVLSVIVRNSGSADSAAETLTYYRADTSDIAVAGTAIAGKDADVGVLSGTDPNANTFSDDATVQVPNTAGTYYYYACVTSSGTGSAEDTNSNNDCSSRVAVEVTAPPSQAANLTLGALTVGGGSTASVTVDGDATFAVTVTNSGNAASVSETLKYYRSTTDGNNDPQSLTSIEDVAISALDVNGTAPGGSTLTVTGTVGTTYYYFACVSTGSTTNCSNTVAVTVTAAQAAAANLTLGTLKVNDSSTAIAVTEGGSADFTVTVTNKGNADSESETLTYYSNTNNNTTGGTAITGVVTVNALTKNGTIASTNTFSNTKTFSVLGTANEIYYYYACVSTGTATNCSNTVAVGVTAALAANLTLGTLTVGGGSTASITEGGNVDFAVTVTNSGTAASVSETLKYYRSTTDSNNPQPLATSIKDVIVSALTKSGTIASTNTFSDTSTLTVTGTVGTTYYYYACVSTGTATNCSNTVAVTVSAIQAANLTLGTLTVGGGSTASVTVDGDATFAVTVTNSGNAASVSETLKYYRSTTDSNNPQPLATSIKDVAISALDVNGTAPGGSTLTVTGTVGTTYYYFACVSTGTATNCSNTVAVTVNAAATTTPDPQMGELTIADDTVDSDSNEKVQFSVQVENIGGVSSVAETLQYYRSENSNVITSPDGTEIVAGETVAISALGADGIASGDNSFSANGGVYYYYACLTSTGSGSTADSDLTNNCSNKVKVIVLPAPDLVVRGGDGFSVNNQYQNSNAEATFYVGSGVRNAGSADSAAGTLTYYRSTSNNNITSPVASEAIVPAQVVTVDVLAAGGLADADKKFSITGNTGVYYYYACVTTGSGSTADSNPDDNCTSKLKVNVGVTGNGTPDLSVFGLALATPTNGNVQSSGDITLSFGVVNIGDVDSGNITFDYYVSEDSTAIVPADDVGKKISSVTTANTDTTAAAADASLDKNGRLRKVTSGNITVQNVASDTTYYYTVCVSDANEEAANNNNNCDQLRVDVIQ